MAKPTFKISCEAQKNIAVIRIDGTIARWKDSAVNFRTQIDSLVASGIQDATVYLNTMGGDCFEANEIVNEILKFKGVVKAELGAICASAGTYIASKCSSVSAARNVSYMIHKPMMIVDGNSDEIKAQLKGLEIIQAEYAKVYSEKTGLPVSKIEEMWVEDYWMNAEEAKSLGFVDEIEGEVDITQEDVEAISAYKNAPKIVATAKITKQLTTNQISTEMRELLITMSGLAANSTDMQLVAYFDALKVKAAKADALQAQLTALQNSAIEEKASIVVDAAERDKKITARQKDFWKKNLIADFAGTKAELDAMPGLTALSSVIKPGAAGATEDRSGWTYADYQEKNPKALAALANEDEPRFKMLFEAHYGIKLS